MGEEGFAGASSDCEGSHKEILQGHSNVLIYIVSRVIAASWDADCLEMLPRLQTGGYCYMSDCPSYIGESDSANLFSIKTDSSSSSSCSSCCSTHQRSASVVAPVCSQLLLACCCCTCLLEHYRWPPDIVAC